jgi:hypothetical protein
MQAELIARPVGPMMSPQHASVVAPPPAKRQRGPEAIRLGFDPVAEARVAIACLVHRRTCSGCCMNACVCTCVFVCDTAAGPPSAARRAARVDPGGVGLFD